MRLDKVVKPSDSQLASYASTPAFNWLQELWLWWSLFPSKIKSREFILHVTLLCCFFALLILQCILFTGRLGSPIKALLILFLHLDGYLSSWVVYDSPIQNNTLILCSRLINTWKRSHLPRLPLSVQSPAKNSCRWASRWAQTNPAFVGYINCVPLEQNIPAPGAATRWVNAILQQWLHTKLQKCPQL